jgi:translocation and assembly module TamB
VVAAELETIQVASLLNRLQPDMGWRGDLTLGGRIDISSSAQGLDADIVLARGQGDLSLVDDLGQAQAMGLSELRLALSAHDGRWQFAQGLVGARIGSLVGAQVLSNPPGQRWPQPGAALQGLLEAQVANLGVWRTWLPPGWRLSGALNTVAQFDGTLGAPRITGSMRGSQLGLRNVLEGVNLTDGTLDLQLTGDQARIERFSFQGGDGRLDITGGADLGAQPKLALQLVAERFRLLGRIDRRVVASGQASVTLSDKRLKIDGDFSVDEGLFDIGRGDAPTLDSDVRLQRGASDAAAAAAAGAAGQAAAGSTTTAAQPVQVQMQVKVNLGPNLQLRGQGVDTRLSGDLMVTSPGNKLAVNGTVSTVDGRFAAYGQRLEITRGRFVFSGEPGNPRIDVLAIRPNLDVQVGVLVEGQAQNPRIQLYSEPDMADYDKLSWLVLGRSPDGLGSADTALLQRAAFALLSGNSGGPTDKLLDAIGLTDFSFRQTEGDTRDTIVSLGKQLSRRWYVGYERGVHATTGTWQLIYRVAQRFTLRAQSGSENAIDLIWTWRW